MNLRDSLVRPSSDNFFRKIVAQNQRAVSLQVKKHEFRVANELIVGYNDILSLIRLRLTLAEIFTRQESVDSSTVNYPENSARINLDTCFKNFSICLGCEREQKKVLECLPWTNCSAEQFPISFTMNEKNDEKLVTKIKGLKLPLTLPIWVRLDLGVCAAVVVRLLVGK